MRFSLGLARWLPVAALVSLASCTDPPPGTDTTEQSEEDDGTTLMPGTAGDAPMSSTSTSETGVLDEASGTGQQGGGECSFFEQDCRDGEKCVPWSELPDLVPDEIRCCPIAEPVVEAGDICSVTGYLGSCIDNCAVGSMCFDFDGDGEGVCQKMCAGTAENPECPNVDDECFIYYSGVPLCFRTCDPLVQDCPPDKGCYPDAIAEGGTGFLCMPTIGDSQLGDYCWLLSACNPGMLCATPDLLPNCFGDADDAGCCTDICDVTEVPDPCKNIHPELECVAWYYQGAEPPSAELQDVGACVLPEGVG
ncbi:hypothetical protein [Paraliomyxa miuraensis]|uniref:hypothetical protein n=1 Tax=Paraliomyxa miuraensis TaxID=376150 RepID=UPI0022589FEB|nr:hypothetical protein [Paraliomyxa miuraensis]MCX4247296.1 hypothetical protein [Paraliomyxa miuraensis]